MKIRNRLFMHITLSVCVLVTAFMFLFLRNLANDENERFQGKIDLYSSMMPGLFTGAMYEMDNRRVDYLVSALDLDPELSRIEVKDYRGETLVKRTKNASGKLIETRVDLVHGTVPVGTLILEYSDDLIQARLKQTLFYYLAMLGVLLAVLGGVVYWTSFAITRPLYQIVDLVREISAGQPEGDASIEAQGELGVLLDAVRSLRSELAEREASILKAKEEGFAHELETTLAKQQLELEHEAHQKTEALRSELQTSLDDLQNTQQQLMTSEKMASLGSIVAGVSHEINTPVGNSLVSATYLNDKSREFCALVGAGTMKRSQLEGYLQVITDATETIITNLQRAADLVRSFKQVSVDQSSDADRVFNFNDYLASVVRSLHHQIKRTPFQINVDCPQDVCVSSCPGAIAQIITNFIMNSLKHGFRDRQEGTISIRVRAIEPASLELVYRDDGRGMDAETLLRHFDPFYTTMRNKGGSGLGTYVVYNLVTQRLQGSIDAESVPDKGVKYVIQFPVQFVEAEACS